MTNEIQPLTVVDKFDVLFPNCKVWMCEAYKTDEIDVVDFEIYTKENIIKFPKNKALRIKDVIFDDMFVGAEVDKSYFTPEEHKQLLFLTSLDLRDYSYQQMNEIINAKFN